MQCKIKWVGWQWGVAYYNGALPHFLTIEISAECQSQISQNYISFYLITFVLHTRYQ